VRVTVAGGGGFGGPAASAAPGAAQTTTASEVELLAAAPTNTGGAGRGGFRAGLTGTVSAIDATSISVTAADGTVTQVATDASTVWVQQTVITRDRVTVGSSVRFTVAGGPGGFGGGFPGGGQGQGAGQGGQAPQGGFPAPGASGAPGGNGFSLTASDVEVLLPAA
jgi:hypothetical protein